MWNLSKGNRFLWGNSITKLQKMYNAETNPKAQIRLLAAIHRKQGKSLDDISELLMKSRTTVHGWLTKFQKEGISARYPKKQTGRPPQLSTSQRKELARILEKGPPHNRTGLWDTKSVNKLIQKKYGRVYVNQHVWRILKGLGFTLQRPRKRHYKSASVADIKKFKKKQNERPHTIERKDLLWAHKMKQHLG